MSATELLVNNDSCDDLASLDAIRQTGRILEGMGHRVEEAYPPALNRFAELRDAVLILATSRTAAHLDIWSARIGRTVGSEDVSPLLWKRAELGRSYSAVQVNSAIERLAAGGKSVAEWWAQGFDLLVTPTMPQLPAKWEDEGAHNEAGFVLPFSVTGQPAISLPISCNSENLRIGVHRVADYGREDLLLGVAAQLEEAAPWATRRPHWHA